MQEINKDNQTETLGLPLKLRNMFNSVFLKGRSWGRTSREARKCIAKTIMCQSVFRGSTE